MADHRLEPGLAVETAVGDGTDAAGAERRSAPGRVALLLALLMVAAVVAALAVDAPDRYLAATVLALAADALSLAALITGLVAAIRGTGRLAAVSAVVLAVLGNPLVLLYALGALA